MIVMVNGHYKLSYPIGRNFYGMIFLQQNLLFCKNIIANVGYAMVII